MGKLLGTIIGAIITGGTAIYTVVLAYRLNEEKELEKVLCR